MINIERHFDFSVVNRGVRILVLSGPHVVLSLYLLFNNIVANAKVQGLVG